MLSARGGTTFRRLAPGGVADRNMKRLVALVVVAACHGAPCAPAAPDASPDGVRTDAAPTARPAAPPVTPATPACSRSTTRRPAAMPAAVAALSRARDARTGSDPLWANGRALFSADHAVTVAGDWNGWSPTIALAPFCSTQLVLAVDAGRERLPHVQARRRHDVVARSAEPRVRVRRLRRQPRRQELGAQHARLGPRSPRQARRRRARPRSATAATSPRTCRPATTPTRHATYPVLFMHDGQNVWDDHDCCFGHTGWEVNVALDSEIAAGTVAPIIVIAARQHDRTRNNEYGLDATRPRTFMQFQVTELQPHALAQVRWRRRRSAIAGSSLGGLDLDGARAAPSRDVRGRRVALRRVLAGHGHARRAARPLRRRWASSRSRSTSTAAAPSPTTAMARPTRSRSGTWLVGFGLAAGDSPACTAGPERALLLHRARRDPRRAGVEGPGLALPRVPVPGSLRQPAPRLGVRPPGRGDPSLPGDRPNDLRDQAARICASWRHIRCFTLLS